MKERKIRFKAWDKEKKEWIRPKFGGDLCVSEDIIIVRDFKPNNNGGYSFSEIREYQASDVIVIQFTGLLDKCGKEIYEGDIIKLGCYTHIDYPDGFIGKIIWEKKSACFILFIPNTQARVAHNMAAGIHNCISNDNNEIIGNIYEDKK